MSHRHGIHVYNLDNVIDKGVVSYTEETAPFCIHEILSESKAPAGSPLSQEQAGQEERFDRNVLHWPKTFLSDNRRKL
jgi:hypothetical protein